MQENDEVAAIVPEATGWRRYIHANPELGFAEHETAAFVAAKLKEFGLAVHTDVSATAVVATLAKGTSGKAIALRAELDALPIKEATGLAYASRNDGVMHACGHDGHTAMLLGAAKLLAESESFDGTVVFVFQPAEEVLGGGKKMIADGLLKRFPVEQVFAVHNWPGFPEGHIGVRAGAQMAAVDDFEIVFRGSGCHAAMPHQGDDPLLAAASFITAIQRLVSRSVDPLSPAVLSVTQIHGGRFNNFVPGEVKVEGTCRFYDRALSNHCAAEIERVAQASAAMHGASAELTYKRGYPPVVNPADGAALAALAGADTVGTERVSTEFQPSMGCEDFAFLLQGVGDGAYLWIGAGDVGPGAGLHGDRFIFNEAIIPIGIRFFLNLVQRALPVGGR
ncbi:MULTISPECIES: amidohydrolase [unclassified Mesorhizobium]|uniref:amidohydrolase n=1 Tax=unclassified Mesorhizobium TaxID=325217 RepID=UPI000F764758|nr:MULTISPECIES: amidohydrolase [unclassified Mesorhizobium]TGT61570.1 amidohydrolase [Mesorhizobium sp. M00.F.Ca.ET.170.01.1.1]AZO08960.1 amidohydrolase [Mesorhizobium sp. M3A.F.Ca.ET.080.04.2.1]RWB68188.1 MAG: amidohydrolase [Mesorhizobium sp.]RWB84569.1 MAG: amidohydrolase [Mesorhizobium sp.]RWE26468.1 MAG: amidohydrolase [Mesorhizobium sp.]